MWRAARWQPPDASRQNAGVAALSKPRVVIVTADDFGLSREVRLVSSISSIRIHPKVIETPSGGMAMCCVPKVLQDLAEA